MDGKFIYILLLIGYFVFKFFSEDKKAKERKQKMEREKNPGLPSPETTSRPTQQKPWDEILREIMDEAQQAKKVVMNPPPFASSPKPKPVAKKKRVEVPVKKTPATASAMISEIEASNMEGGGNKQQESYDIAAYHLEETSEGRTIDLREAVIQSVILNRPEY